MLGLESAGEKVTLRPVRNTTPLAKEKGVRVFRTGQPLPASATDNVLQEIRDERDRQNMGDAE